MKKIGIVGGVAWLSTVDYYSHICRRSEQWNLEHDGDAIPAMPEMVIESLDINKAVAYIGTDGDEESWSRFDEYHRTALERVEASGADFAIIASNTPHHRFEAIVRGIGIPVISILDVTAETVSRTGANRALILGTALTMSSQRFRDGFAKYGIEAAGPEDDLTRSMTIQLIADLQMGKLDGAAERLERIVITLFTGQVGVQPVVCLACTELPSAFQELKLLPIFEVDGIVYINTTTAHANAAFDFAVERLTVGVMP